ncbi:hypothetical protein AMAG_17493 [Allomyces macrogynus ATCC 38327]|uniref:SigF-like NTF2-like domain-containing protein n=1 Tax=Allomyces macrogynus (strain ATCC 38327) TaxID=578462 RepID=A0A0L0TF94_ALLM3|nr:hypothetical protein AMAG_17493 [Allomyces macrogynus ATCC 38327]|eukprot:KNE73341.1 hypothetical protein AMAG_17493 [Allomyces macrogynus ATCC 38327]
MDSTHQATVERAITRLLESRSDADFRHAISAYYTRDADFIHPLVVAKGRAEIAGAFRVWRSLYRQSQHKTHIIWYHDRAAPAVLDAVAWRRAHVDPAQVVRQHEEDVPAATGSETMERVVTLEVAQDAHVMVAGKVQLHGISQLTLRASSPLQHGKHAQDTVERAITRLLESRSTPTSGTPFPPTTRATPDFIHPLVVAKGRAEIAGAFRVWRSLYRQSQHKTHIIWYHDRAAPAVLDAVAWRRAHVDPAQVVRQHEEDVPAATGSETMERVVTLEVAQDAHVMVAGKCRACTASLADPHYARAAVVTHCGHLFWSVLLP